MLGLYIHIPFCPYICHYCDFVKMQPKNNQVITDYLANLSQEILTHQDKFSQIDSIYLGGGTPSMLDLAKLEQLFMILAPIKAFEYTIEINPDTYSKDLGELLKKYGINRVSLGVQTFQNDLLKYLNRGHRQEDVKRTVEDLQRLGISNISIDLIFAIPNQTIENIADDINQAVELGVKHISYYALILEDKTYFYHQFLNGNFIEVDSDLQADMYEFIIEKLTNASYHQYEISNFSLHTYQSFHNMKYWTQKEYLGVGLGAHGFHQNHRTENHRSLVKYAIKNQKERQQQTREDNLTDELIFGLRLTKGIELQPLEEKYGIVFLERFPAIHDKMKLGLIELVNGYLRLTKKGVFLSNEVLEVFI